MMELLADGIVKGSQLGAFSHIGQSVLLPWIQTSLPEIVFN